MTPTALWVTAEPALRNYWYPVARADALVDSPIARRLLGEDLVLWRSTSGVAAALDRCPHRGARLSLGWVDNSSIVCPYHGWEYGSDGRVSCIPTSPPGSALPPKAVLDVALTEERYGWIWVCLDADPVVPIPDVPEFGSDGWRAVHEPESMWDCAAPHIIDNNLIPSHVAFVHRGTFGNPQRPEVDVPEPESTPFGLRTSNEYPVESRPGEVGSTTRITSTEVHAPFLMVIRLDYPDGLTHIMVKACTPVDDRVTRQLQIVIRNDDEASRPSADIVAFDADVWTEDKLVLETGDPTFHIDLTAEVHVNCDRSSIEYKRLLGRVLDGTFPDAVV